MYGERGIQAPTTIPGHLRTVTSPRRCRHVGRRPPVARDPAAAHV